VLLVLPAFGVNTADAYGWLASARAATDVDSPRSREVLPLDVSTLIDASSLDRWEYLATLAQNDFEPVVAARHPQISSLVARLRAAGCSPAMMSGSGSTVFGVLPAAHRVDLPQFAEGGSATAPRVLLTRTAERVEPVVLSE